jgi:hypothetical protein
MNDSEMPLIVSEWAHNQQSQGIPRHPKRISQKTCSGNTTAAPMVQQEDIFTLNGGNHGRKKKSPQNEVAPAFLSVDFQLCHGRL